MSRRTRHFWIIRWRLLPALALFCFGLGCAGGQFPRQLISVSSPADFEVAAARARQIVIMHGFVEDITRRPVTLGGGPEEGVSVAVFKVPGRRVIAAIYRAQRTGDLWIGISDSDASGRQLNGTAEELYAAVLDAVKAQFGSEKVRTRNASPGPLD